MLPRRRIFRSRRVAIRPGRGALIAVAFGVFGLGLFGLGPPTTQILRSAPGGQVVLAAAAEVRVVDGETLRLRDRTVRLLGLGAPGRGTRCGAGDGTAGAGFDCGEAAAAALARLVADRVVACHLEGRDRAGHRLGVCEARTTAAALAPAAAGPVPLNLAMVSGGWAVAIGDALPELRSAEAAARGAGRGLWAGGAPAWPEAWRGRR